MKNNSSVKKTSIKTKNDFNIINNKNIFNLFKTIYNYKYIFYYF